MKQVNIIEQKLKEFEQMDEIQASDSWEELFLTKLQKAQHTSVATKKSFRMAAAMLCLLLINIGFLISFVINSSQQTDTRSETLQSISNELLINPTGSK